MSHVSKISEMFIKLNEKGIKSPETQQLVVEECMARAILAYLTMTGTSRGMPFNLSNRDDVLNVMNKWNEISPFDVEAVSQRVNFIRSTIENQIISGFIVHRGRTLVLDKIENAEGYNPCECEEFKSLFMALTAELIKYCNN